MFMILGIVGTLISVFAVGGIIGEVTGTKKTLSELPMLELPTVEDECDDIDVDGEDVEIENVSDETETEDFEI